MPSSIISPFPVFNDLDGTPLENGYIYIGQSNLNPETAPVNVYWDAAQTIPAAQPIRTIGGFPSRNGSPGNIYIAEDAYSISVRNKNKVFVFAAQVPSIFPISGTEVLFTQAGAGAVTRNIQEKAREFLSVKDFGAVGDGITDDVLAFNAAISAAVGSDALDNSFNVEFPLCVTIYVPAGNYFLGSIVDVKGKDVTYILDHGASFSPVSPNPWTGTNRLNGRVVRNGLHFSANHFGIKDKAGTLSIHGAPAEGYDEGAYINGFANPYQLADVLDRDSCTLVVSNRNPSPYATVSSANYTSTEIIPLVPLSANEVKSLKVGMTIDTLHPVKYSGFVTSWGTDGTYISVSGWFQQNNQSSGQIPPNGVGALVQNFTKVFAQNNLVWLDRGVNKASRCSGFELDLHNNRSAPGATDSTGVANTDYLWGFDAAATGRYGSTVGFLARGPYQQAFHSFPQSVSVTSGNNYSRVGSTVTVTSTLHGLVSGNIIVVSSATDTNLDGYSQITVTGPNSFTFTKVSAGSATGTLSWAFQDYSNIGYFYTGNGTGLRFDNLSPGSGKAISVNNFGLGEVMYVNATGYIYTNSGIGLVKTSGDALSWIKTGSTGNSILRLETTSGTWSIVGWQDGHFSIYDQINAIEKLRADLAAGGNVIAGANFVPLADNSYTNGESGKRWSQIWAANGAIQTSDERTKTDISDSTLGLQFINLLRPVCYRFKVGENKVVKQVFRNAQGDEVDANTEGAVPSEVITEQIPGQRLHFGLIAQEVKKAIPENTDFGGWILTDKNDQNSEQALRYEEFIAPIIKSIQELSKKVAELESKII